MFYKVAHVILSALFFLLFRFRVTGRENVPQGGVLLCGNHSSLSDPVFVALALSAKDQPCFMGKAELFKIFGLGWLIRKLGAFPVERGASDLGAIKKSLSLLSAGRKLLIFPQGRRVQKEDAMALKAGAAMLAARSGVPILPLYITEGRKIFINRVEVIIGKPFAAEKKPGQGRAEAYEMISNRLMEEILSLSKQTQKAKKSR